MKKKENLKSILYPTNISHIAFDCKIHTKLVTNKTKNILRMDRVKNIYPIAVVAGEAGRALAPPPQLFSKDFENLKLRN